MKKILATLLVATMLLSCISFVGFAADVSVYTVDTFPNADMNAFDPDESCDFVSELTRLYYAYMRTAFIYDGSTLTVANARKTPIMAAIKAGLDDGAEYSYTLPTVVTTSDVVMFPIYVENVQTTTVDIKWDVDYLVYAGVYGNYNPGVKDGTLDEAAGSATVACITTEQEDISGLGLAVAFKIKDGAVGDKDGNATTEISMSLNPVNKTVSRVDASATATLGVSSMDAKLSGLTPGEEEEKDPTPITQTEVNAMTAVKTGGTIAAGTNVLEGITVDGGDGADVSEAEAYSAVFATIDLTDKDKTDVEFGFILRAKDGNGADRFFKAEKEYGGKYGVAFFGTSEVLGWYKAVPAVKLADGTILENATAAQEL